MPERSCIVCREKKEKSELFRIAKLDEKYRFDKKQTIQSRAVYICKTHECIKRVLKNKKIAIPIEDLMAMVNLLKNANKDYLKILRAMRGSEFLTFGINLVLEGIEHIHFIIIAEDISEKNDKKLVGLAKKNGIPYVHYGTKMELGDIFNKNEVNVVGVTNKKIARGMID